MAIRNMLTECYGNYNALGGKLYMKVDDIVSSSLEDVILLCLISRQYSLGLVISNSVNEKLENLLMKSDSGMLYMAYMSFWDSYFVGKFQSKNELEYLLHEYRIWNTCEGIVCRFNLLGQDVDSHATDIDMDFDELIYRGLFGINIKSARNI
jgi:hypothetical protein